ncbi:hypothetical protein WJX74_009459 [Apatococcus lobatus]|uniref:glutathione transferase n=2 Tax=Apatococcus TaxID=904362 RepID=A0AAW1T3U2_9CHLO
MAGEPTIHYFPIRGRAEPLKLVLTTQGVSFKLHTLGLEEIKDLSNFKFGQAPAYSDDEVEHLVQSNAILRHLGRKYNLYGSSRTENAAVDEAIDGVEDLQLKYVGLIYGGKLADDAKASYWSTHGDPKNKTARNGGAHLGFLASLLSSATNGHIVGSSLTIADVAVWNITDNHLQIFPKEIEGEYPELAQFHKQFASLPAIKSYLNSDLRLGQNNGNGLG